MKTIVKLEKITAYTATSGSNAGKEQHILKLVNKTVTKVEDAFGITESVAQRTFYRRISPGADVAKLEALKGKDTEIDTANFSIVERAFVDSEGNLPIGEDGEPISDELGQPIMLKWLTPKAS